jgi:hypothetical protein
VRPRTLLILLGVVAGLLLFIRFYEHDVPSSDERATQAKKLLRFKKEDVIAVSLEANGTAVRLQRVKAAAAGKEAEWRMTQPLAVGADNGAVDRLLETLGAVEQNRDLGAVDPKTVGLVSPRGKVVLTTAQGDTRVSVGAQVPTGGELVARVEGPGAKSGVYILIDTLWSELLHKPDDWRDRKMFQSDRDHIERIALTPTGGQRLLLVKHPDGFWMESPIADRADHELVDKLLTDLTALSAEAFADGAPAQAADLGLTSPRALVEVGLRGQAQPIRIELGASHNEPAPPATPGAPPQSPTPTTLTWMRIGGQTFESRGSLDGALERAPAAWRSMSLAGVEVHQVDSVAVRDANGAATTLTRSGPDWKRGGVTISYLPVSELLFALLDAKADRLLSSAEAQEQGVATKPVLHFALTTQVGPETIEIFPPLPSGVVPARVTGRDAILLLPVGKTKDLTDKLAAVRSEKALPPESSGK